MKDDNTKVTEEQDKVSDSPNVEDETTINEEENSEDQNKESNTDDSTKEESQEDKFRKLTEELFKAKDENNKLNNELNTLKDRLQRVNAEYDNFRKRTAKEKEGIYADACGDVLKEMLGVLDNLERAVAVEEGSVDDLKAGVNMTMRQFTNAFEKLGVEEIETSGEFNPHLHQAVMHIEDPNLDRNSIAEVFQKGYKKGDKVLRYSVVKVAN